MYQTRNTLPTDNKVQSIINDVEMDKRDSHVSDFV